MEADNFNDFLEKLLDKISTENKDVFLLGDYNMDLLKSDIKPISAFLETMTSNRVIPTSSTIIDNIFSNSINFSTCTSGNLMTSISDHFPQFLIIPVEILHLPRKHNTVEPLSAATSE